MLTCFHSNFQKSHTSFPRSIFISRGLDKQLGLGKLTMTNLNTYPPRIRVIFDASQLCFAWLLRCRRRSIVLVYAGFSYCVNIFHLQNVNDEYTRRDAKLSAKSLSFISQSVQFDPINSRLKDADNSCADAVTRCWCSRFAARRQWLQKKFVLPNDQTLNESHAKRIPGCDMRSQKKCARLNGVDLAAKFWTMQAATTDGARVQRSIGAAEQTDCDCYDFSAGRVEVAQWIFGLERSPRKPLNQTLIKVASAIKTNSMGSARVKDKSVQAGNVAKRGERHRQNA